MLSIVWGKKNDSTSTKTKTLENLANRSCLNEMIKSSYNYNQYSYDFLNSCHLCHKPLSGKEIYMYRGEMGFCSVECRNRQMYLDDMKKIEVTTRRILASFHERRRGGPRCEIRGVGGVNGTAAPPIFISK